ncbi:RNA-binding protein 48 [Odontomachus brunneus]|uniref:RNA-binding protein 48 n=1 Tax=Odontomachus brunneus TaxID=486640 RepID=UPI0013F1B68C|nr:RNA-binding protein 48 [Odontomachus brunneus]XP_032672928.1 RNA-binding protein 48 [Odontomachus brunneus]
MAEQKCTITYMPHHVQQKLCKTRPPYRQGKRLTSVKVYTINDESQHLLICGVPNIKLGEEVKKLTCPYGDIKAIQLVTEYPSEEFTETYHIHYARIQSARIAKRFIDNKNFFGGLLHVFYVPELETLSETKAKLTQRRKDVATRIKRNQTDLTNPEVDKFVPRDQYHRKKRTPALPLTEERVKHCYPGETISSICDGIPQDIDPRSVSEPSLPVNWNSSCSNNTVSEWESLSAPYQPTEAVIQAGSSRSSENLRSNVRKRNYKGQLVNDDMKVKISWPRIIDTRNIARLNSTEKTNVFCNVKKVNSGITVKLLERSNNDKKKIVIKNPNVTHLIQPSEDLRHSIQMAKSHIRTAMQKIFK